MYHALMHDTVMSQLSKHTLDKKVEEELCNTLDLVISKLGDADTVRTFLLSFLTRTERIMLAKRLSVIILLNEGVSHEHIAQALHVTRVTVARMQLFMEARGEGLEVVFEIMKNEKVLKELKSALLKLVGYTVRAAGGRVKSSIF